MKKITIENKKSPNFIGAYDIQNQGLCKKIVDFFEKNPSLHSKGKTGSGYDPKSKKTTDLTIKPSDINNPKYDIFRSYFETLNKCFLLYKDEYPFLKTFLNKVNIGYFNIQKYMPSDHFSRLHSERTSIKSLHRIFAFMTYLNDVDDGGQTKFDYYDIAVKPETGKTLIWPAEWTHAHTGEILKSGKKYIITGWMHFES
jgi:prolyl 4-hydroxylase